jgi:large subunit ribosomal protein L7/L12
VTLERSAPVEGPTEEHYFVSLAVGPSNVERIARLIGRHTAIEADEARTMVRGEACEVAMGTDKDAARQLVRAAIEEGATAELVTRVVALRLVDVLLEEVGKNKLGVIVALRAHREMSVSEAKQLVEAAPATVMTRVEEDKAGALIAALNAAGASARAN